MDLVFMGQHHVRIVRHAEGFLTPRLIVVLAACSMG
jgi:hypothetical protein